MKKVLAIDPGNDGAFVYLDSKNKFEFEIMPINKNGKFKDVDFFSVEKILRRFENVDMVFLERARAGAMGVTGAFNYGRGFAALEIAIQLLELPVTYVEPAAWCKVMHEGLSSDLKPKAKSILAANRLYQKLISQIPKGPKSGKLHEGVVDALLLAGYGLRK